MTARIDQYNVENFIEGKFKSKLVYIDNIHIEWRLLDNFPEMTRLYFQDVTFPNSSLSGIEKFTCLTSLSISSNTRQLINFSAIDSLVNIRELTLENQGGTYGIENALDISFIRKFKKLRSLSITHSNILSLDHILDCTSLTKLNINGIDHAELDQTKLSNLVNLKDIQYFVSYRSECLQFNELEGLTKLRNVRGLHNNKLVYLSNLKNLEVRLDAEDLSQLEMFPNLEMLRIIIITSKSNSKPKWIKCLPKLIYLNIETSGTLDLDHIGIETLQNLKYFKYNGQTNILSINSLAKCPILREIYVSANQIDSFDDIGKCSELTHISIIASQKNVFDIDIKNFDGLKKLSFMLFKYVNISNIHLLNNLQSLKTLKLFSIGIDECSDLTVSLPNLSSFQVGNNSFSDLLWLHAPQLQKINVNFSDVKSIDLKRYPKLTTLEALSSLLKLEDLEGLETLDNLVKFSFKGHSTENNIDKLVSSKLECISISANIRSFPFERFPNLKYFYADNNALESINGIELCPKIINLKIEYNPIRDFSPICSLRYLDFLACDLDYIDEQDPRTRRIIHRHLNNVAKKITSIYGDNQNVHDSFIQKSINNSLNNILKDPIVNYDSNDVLVSNLSVRTKEAIIEYCSDSNVHSILDIKFSELFAYVWARIKKHPNCDELMKILEEQIEDSECMCFTGRFNRLISVLVGFYDDVEINISDSSRISAVIIETGNSINPYNPKEHKRIATNKLLDIGYTIEDISVWVDAIDFESME